MKSIRPYVAVGPGFLLVQDKSSWGKSMQLMPLTDPTLASTESNKTPLEHSVSEHLMSWSRVMPWFRSLRIPSFVLLEAYTDIRHAYKQTGGHANYWQLLWVAMKFQKIWTSPPHSFVVFVFSFDWILGCLWIIPLIFLSSMNVRKLLKYHLNMLKKISQASPCPNILDPRTKFMMCKLVPD